MEVVGSSPASPTGKSWSSGAFAVVDGALEERTIVDGVDRTRRVSSGEPVSFGADHVHAVVNATPGAVTSVHVYSPPLRSMSFSRAANGELVVDRVDDVAGALAVP